MSIELPSNIIEKLKLLSYNSLNYDGSYTESKEIVDAYNAGKEDGKIELAEEILKAIGILQELDVEVSNTENEDEE